MKGAKPITTPMSTYPALTKHGSPLPNPTNYHALLDRLQYLSFTHPDIAYSVNKLSQYMKNPTVDHWSTLKRLLRDLVGIVHHGILLNH